MYFLKLNLMILKSTFNFWEGESSYVTFDWQVLLAT